MKRFSVRSSLFAVVLGVLCISAVNPAFSQDGATTTNAATVREALQGVVDAFNAGATNWFFVATPVYAPNLAEHWGATVALNYRVNDYLLAGPRFDYVNGGFYMMTGTVTLQLPLQPLKGVFPKLWVIPFGYGGAGAPISGDQKGVLTGIVGTGAAIRFVEIGHWRLELVGDIEKWTGLPGKQYRCGPLVNYNF